MFSINQNRVKKIRRIKIKKQTLVAVLITGLCLIPVGVSFAGYNQETIKAQPDIVETAVSAGSFGTLVAALNAAGLVETLQGDGPFTVFAPTDEAFAKLPEGTVADLLKPENKEKLTAILTYHVVPGKVMAGDVVNLKLAKTVNGKNLSIAVGTNGVRIDNANVVKTDIETSNGVIHIIDEVIIP